MPLQGQNEVKGYQRFAHELASSLAAVEGVALCDPAISVPVLGLAYEEFALRWHLPCLVPGNGDGRTDDRSLPWSADTTRAPAGAVRGAMPLDGVAKEISRLMFQSVTAQGFQPRSTAIWDEDAEEFEVIRYLMGDYNFTITIGPGPREDLAEVTIRIMIEQPEFEGRRSLI